MIGCDQCQTLLLADDQARQWAGRVVMCPRCQHQQIVPLIQQPTAAASQTVTRWLRRSKLPARTTRTRMARWYRSQMTAVRRTAKRAGNVPGTM